MKAAIITIGDEILLGQVVDTNSAWIGQVLNKVDVSIQKITSISDDSDAIVKSINESSQIADIILVTGGLGPTKDDITKKTISEYFNSPLVRNEKVLDHVKGIFQKIGKDRVMPVANYGQADVLSCAEVLFNDVGTAPGMLVNQNGKLYIFLPGVPFEMKFLMEKYILPKLIKLSGDEYVAHEHIITVGLGESHLAEKIKDIEDSLPVNIKLAYLPKFGLVRLRLTGKSINLESLSVDLKKYSDLIAERLSKYLVSRADVSLEEEIVKSFCTDGLKVATAESCTGGNIAGAITSVAGASQIFDCGIVSYSNAIKQQVLGVGEETLKRHGAVSEETVLEMVAGVKKISKAHYAIATSGIAGPGGGNFEKPVGTVWVAISGLHETVTKKFSFSNSRQVNIERSVMQALILLWNLYKKENY